VSVDCLLTPCVPYSACRAVRHCFDTMMFRLVWGQSVQLLTAHAHACLFALCLPLLRPFQLVSVAA
jgi:hypothetical protein